MAGRHFAGGHSGIQAIFSAEDYGSVREFILSIANARDVERVNLCNSGLRQLPPEISKLRHVTELKLDNNYLETLPPEIGGLSNLRFLYAENSGLRRLPEEIGDLVQLTELDLPDNALSALPSSIGRLSNLTGLTLRNNNLRSLPAEIGQLAKLEELYLNENHLESVPPELGNLNSLQILQLGHNRLKSLPPTIGNLTFLQECSLNHNHLEQLPPEIGNLCGLDFLDLSNNRLTSLPPEIAALLENLELSIEHNPLDKAFLVAYRRGESDLQAYLSSLLEGAMQLREAKMLFVGEGGVGKSSLLAALAGEPFVENRPRTHGMEIKPLFVSHPDGQSQIVLNCWDFGGQRVYRVTHQFFFSARSLFILCWRPRQGAQQNDIEGWLKHIYLRVGNNARVLLVATHYETDEHIAQIDKHFFQGHFGELIADFYNTDAKTEFGIAQVREATSQLAAGLPQMGERLSATWIAARDDILSINRPHITFSTFCAKCREHGVTGRAPALLAELLHDLGHIIHYGEDNALSDFVVLKPEWLNRSIGCVLEDQETDTTHGVLQHCRLADIWKTYPRKFHPYFLRLMEKFDASYRIDDATSLVAELVPDARPDAIPWAPRSPLAEGMKELSLVCAMEDVPDGLIPRLIVRNHRYNGERLHWQHGIFLRDPRHGEAFLELVDRELRVTVRSAYPSHFMSLISDSITTLIDTHWLGLVYRLSVPCPQFDESSKPCRGRFELDALRQFKVEGDTEYRCQACKRHLDIDTLLTGFPAPSDKYSVKLILERLDEARRHREQLAAEARGDISRYASYFAESIRIILRVLSTETPDCPRLFTLLPADPVGWARLDPRYWADPLNWGARTFDLTLWCEMPGEEHPLCSILDGGAKADPQLGQFSVRQPLEYMIRIAPLIKFVGQVLKLTVPLVGSASKTLLDETILKHTSEKLDLMEKIGDALLSAHPNSLPTVEQRRFRRVQDDALRQFRGLLKKLDGDRHWGGLRRVLTKTGDFLWLCPAHYAVFEPELPKLDVPRT